jgi:uncharacterized Ntn-hydrolase superfamily protein
MFIHTTGTRSRVERAGRTVPSSRSRAWVCAAIPLLGLAAGGCLRPKTEPIDAPPPRPALPSELGSTFSIAGWDAANGDVGVAVQSKFFGVGAVVPWAAAGVGAVATQSYANTTYGPDGLELLRSGSSPEEVVERLTSKDPEKEHRQLGLVDARGRAATFTGKRCIPWAGGRTGAGYAAQGNILVSEATVAAMAKAFEETQGELAEKLLAALEAGQRAGGDARGRQSAALIVARKKGGYGGFNDRYVDLRVDDHPDPIAELRRLLDMQLGKDPASRARKLVQENKPEDALRLLEEASARNPTADAYRFESARLLFRLGRVDAGKAAVREALALAPGYDHHHYQAAIILAAAGLGEDCLDQIRKTLALNPEYAHVLRRELANDASPLRAFREPVETLLRS